MHKQLKLKHKKHTGKLIHHRHTSYPALFLVMLYVGVLMVTMTRMASASDLAVTATVPAPIPSGAPTFTSPADGTVVDHAVVTFTGTCPVITPAVTINLSDQTTFLGSTPCLADGTFSMSAQLAQGERTIVAKVVTFTGDTGGISQPLHVTYTPKPTPAQTPSPTTPGSPSVPGVSTSNLTIVNDTPFITFVVGKPTKWTGHFEGGTTPYQLTIDWGDGAATTDTVRDQDNKSYEHVYKENKNFMVIVSITDATGYKFIRSFAAMSLGEPAKNDTNTLLVPGITDIPNDPTGTVVMLYVIVLVLLGLLWRYEHVYHAATVGIPTHYAWQKHFNGRNKPGI